MPLYSFEGRAPTVDPGAFVAPTATLVGDVHVEAGASVWFNAVLRADFAPIVVREGGYDRLVEDMRAHFRARRWRPVLGGFADLIRHYPRGARLRGEEGGKGDAAAPGRIRSIRRRACGSVGGPIPCAGPAFARAYETSL